MNVYVHFPFCRAKCAYCALLSRAGTSSEARTAYVARLVRELAARGLSPSDAGGLSPNSRGLSPSDAGGLSPNSRGLSPVETVYFGGGTPALCDLSEIKLNLASDCEFTVELHPQDATDARLAELRRLGVNRISLGVQSFDDAVLTAMGRGHTAVEAEAAFRRVQAVFPNSGLDLIAGWPETSEASWRTTIARALALEPVHISCYTLIREPKTRLDLAVRQGRVVLPDDDAALAQVDLARAAFAAAGLRRYEVSNYARPGFECRHNCAVWRGEDYLGFGEGAHGREGLARTVGQAAGYEVMTVTPEEDALERALLGLRTSAGLDLARVARAWPRLVPRLSAWRAVLASLVAPGILAESAPDVFVPTDRGFEVCDAVMAELLSAPAADVSSNKGTGLSK